MSENPLPVLPTPTGSDDPRVYLAAERTFLAWLRTGLGLIGVGFAVARFALFLREMNPAAAVKVHAPTGLSLYSGVFLVSLGVVVNLYAVWHFVHLVRELREGTWVAGRVPRGAIPLGVVLALTGVAMGVYLLVLR